MKFLLLWVNTLSVYYGVYDYARYFSVRHPRVIENVEALKAAYQVRLGTSMVPLETQFGDVTREAEEEAIQERMEEVEKILDEREAEGRTMFNVNVFNENGFSEKVGEKGGEVKMDDQKIIDRLSDC
jgi:hypothetical protein